ncbi:hypothetical protein SBRCBS47491_008598 [Sporothrix bragantina]|uniref:Zn(2)-C6 fungal-type domain-containing protein n=1 Tax=Sporothrix bragantina TaxID=671064 RepID=A0ABP0CMP5_9PEZI
MSSHLKHRRGAPRLYHKKSRLGCLRCKARRVKCDEKHPSCSGCSRHLVECVYPVLDGPVAGQTSVPLRPVNGDTPAAPNTGSGAGSRIWRRGGAAEASTSTTTSSNGRGGGAPTAGNPTSSLLEDEHFFVSGYQAAAFESDPDSLESLDPVESRSRRLTELRLLHHYLLQQSWTFGQLTLPRPGEAGNNSDDQDQDPFIWAVDLVGRAIEGDGHDSILYMLLAHSALSLWVGGSSTGGDRKDQEACAANRLLHQQYMALALRAQRRAVAALLGPSSASTPPKTDTPDATTTAPDEVLQLADAVGTASVLLVNHSFALVQTLPLEPWQPPHEWLQMGRGAMQVMEVAKGYLGDTLARETKRREDMATATAARGSGRRIPQPPQPAPSHRRKEYTSLVAKLLLASPRFDRADMFSAVWAAPYLWLLEEPVADSSRGTEAANGDDEIEYDGGEDETSEGASDASFAPYYATLAYIGWCAAAIARPYEPTNAICRRLAGAAYWFPVALEERLRQRRPRAMVCLAQYFALWIPFEPGRTDPGPRQQGVWMMGSAGRRQVAAIHDALPARWKPKVAPLLSGM